VSINSMANAAAARRPDMVPLGEVPKTLDQVARAASTPPATTPVAPGNTTAAAPASVETTLNVLFGYIPTEVLTLYVAVLAAVQPGKTSNGWLVFWIFLFATPVIVWLVYGAKVKALQKPLPLKFGAWPFWEMLAATAAYMAWAFALPNSPFTKYDWYSAALSGVVVLVISTVLGLLAPFFQKPLSP
jgi:hypothetical protein